MRPVFCAILFLHALPAAADVDECMVGTWTATTGHLKAFYQRINPAVPVTSVDGNVVMNVAADGSVNGTIADFVIDQTIGGQHMTNTAQGRFAFQVATEGARYEIDFNELDLNIKAHMHAGSAPPQLMAEVNQDETDLNVPNGSGTYECSANSLTLVDDDPARTPFPNWVR